MKCLNCGADCDNKYCPECGQPTATSRTTWKSFSLSSLADMLRLKGRFLHTCGHLLLHPWRVIADYTAGRRARYSSPLLFMLTLGIYVTLLSSWIGIDVNDDEVPFRVYLLRFYQFSSGMFALCMLPPAILALRIVYRNHGIHRFNIPELLIAGIFLCGLSYLLDILLMPLYLLGGISLYSVANTLSLLAFITYLIVAIFKAFPIRPRWKGVLVFIGFVILMLVFVVVYILIIEGTAQCLFGVDPRLSDMINHP